MASQRSSDESGDHNSTKADAESKELKADAELKDNVNPKDNQNNTDPIENSPSGHSHPSQLSARKKHAEIHQLGADAYNAGNLVLAEAYFEQLRHSGNPKVFYFLAGISERSKSTDDQIKRRHFCELALSEHNTAMLKNRLASTENRVICLETHQHLEVLTNLGFIHYWGKDGEIDYIKARHYFERGVTLFDSLNNVHGEMDLQTKHRIDPQIELPSGPIELDTIGDPDIVVTPELRLSRFGVSRESVTLACYYLGVIHYERHGTPRNFRNALLYFTRALSGGDNDALIYLAYIYYTGDGGVPVDYKKAREYAEKSQASNCNNSTVSLMVLSAIYQYGYDVPVNIPLALSLLIKLMNCPENDVGADKKTEALRKIRNILATEANLNLFIVEHADLIKRVDETTKELAKVKQEKDELQRQVDYQPDGPGYLAAKQDFELQSEVQAQGLSATQPL